MDLLHAFHPALLFVSRNTVFILQIIFRPPHRLVPPNATQSLNLYFSFRLLTPDKFSIATEFRSSPGLKYFKIALLSTDYQYRTPLLYHGHGIGSFSFSGCPATLGFRWLSDKIHIFNVLFFVQPYVWIVFNTKEYKTVARLSGNRHLVYTDRP